MSDSRPFRSSLRPVKAEWIDYNNHLNMAYYSVLMDEAADDTYPLLGFGPDYLERTGCTTYVAEFHICYLRELHEGDLTYCTVQMMDHDEKRFHLFFELFHEDGWLSATGEGVTLHVNQQAEGGPKVTPFPEAVYDKLADLKSAHADLPTPARSGRRIGLART